MEIPAMIAGLTDAGERLARAAQRAGLGALVPSCPDWAVRDLLFHTGAVHRWAARYVGEGLEAPIREQRGGDPLRDADLRPADDELLEYFREGYTALASALKQAPDDVQCWTFLPAPSPLAFWARRQLHETTVHRIDTELAAGATTAIDPAVATDGIDELLTGFVVRRRGKLRSDNPRTLGVHTTDTDTHWHLTVSNEPVAAEHADKPADATVRGPAVEVYLALWNRLPLNKVDAGGDAELLTSWPQLVQVRWS
ncbi:MAG: maleylpyruvate isomerase family mycothiol-dependent enzyme [Actinophytocola sp.]|nr:maleylpyruvate isomerase family mycothiol-dependent enzyme [Actinophytocola sp.]